MAEITFLFGNHNHQPIGNFDSVFKEATLKAYQPFVDILLEHPSIHWNLHCTGILWEWLELNYPEYLEKVKTMVDRKQLELLSGGFYEPILPIIPDRDKIGQIEKLNLYLKKHFSIPPKGMWCAERVWEPHLPLPIAQAQMEYTVLDDTHFLASGLKEHALSGHYKVEELNHSIDIFPISKDLRYSIPFKKPEEVLEIFKKKAQEFNSSRNTPCLTLMDDGEKFGLWPDTYSSVYKEKWLEKFLQLLEKNSSWLSTKTFSEYRQETPPLGKTYIPCSSYSEMLEWSNGFWRNFLSKYPEANWMHKKMLRVSQKVYDLIEKTKKLSLSKSLKEKIETAQNLSWAGQCNCAYWHGIFGGLYLPILRGAIYKNLIAAERLLDEINQDKEILKPLRNFLSSQILTEIVDFDGDGKNELLIETPAQNLYFAIEDGGTLVEWDFKSTALNLSNPISRRREIYHEKLKTKNEEKIEEQTSVQSIHTLTKSKEEGLESEIVYDWYKRANFIDHFFHADTTLASFQKCNYGEQGDFVENPYLCKLSQNSLSLSRKGMVWVGECKKEVTVSKEIEFENFKKKNQSSATALASAILKVHYQISNPKSETINSLWFGSEFCFSFSVYDPKQDMCLREFTTWERNDPHLHWKLKVLSSVPAELWTFPLETVSNSESGFEKTFQGLIFVPHWKFSLAAGQSLHRELLFEVEKI